VLENAGDAGWNSLETGAIIWLFNPAIALVLASGFLLFWLHQKQQPHLAVLACGYAGLAMGFLLHQAALPIGLTGTRLLSNSFFLLSAVVLASAIISRYGRPVPWPALSALSVGGLLVFSWFLLKEPDLPRRILAMNFALGGISLVVAAELRHAIGRHPLAGFVMALACLSGLNFIFRPLLALNPQGLFGGVQDFESLYWMTALLSHGVLSLVVALSLFAAAALDAMKQYKAEALSDPLSGLLNRRGFEQAAAAALEQARQKGIPVALVIADLDRFKQVNDTFGHQAGDRVLIHFSSLLASAAGPNGIVGRLGGEEFVVLLTAADPAAARLFAEGVRSSFSAAAHPDLPAGKRITASFGVSALEPGGSLSGLLRQADEALYAAKKAGRDCVRLYGGEPRRPVLAA
jgi:diguanylate cyclase (GGDEF)-like protein